MITKSIRLTEEEATELRDFLDLTGEVEAAVLKRAALHGLQELRLEQAALAYLKSGDSYEAAEIARLPRAQFLSVLMDRGVALLKDPSTLLEEVSFLADALGSERLRAAVSRLDEARSEARPHLLHHHA
ncbi:MAG: hypothetical protein HY690_16530 [Chloroflexi bacterium]|nr:hypothetical protein [Chloroflexota bacterium]